MLGRIFMKTVYLLPTTISDDILQIPQSTKEAALGCSLFIVERAKSARSYLKLLGADIHNVEFLEMSREFVKNRPSRVDFIDEVKTIAKNHENIAILSESGCPGVADPGQKIVALAHFLGWCVKPLVGPSSIILAVMASGLNGQNFKFCGYLPKESINRCKTIKQYEIEARKNNQTQVFIETIYRNTWLFDDIIKSCDSSTRFCVAVSLLSKDELIMQMSIYDWRKIDLERMQFIKERLSCSPALFLIQ